MPATTGCPMINFAKRSLSWGCSLATSLTLLTLTACQHPSTIEAAPSITTLTITSEPLHTDIQRFGINLSGQTYYDSGQMLRNFAFRNPGFEGETWQSILHCKSATANTCTDENPYTVWPANFLAGAHYQVLPNGASGTVTASSAAAPPNGVTLTLSSSAPAANGFLLVRIDKPGEAQAGWWTDLHNGATLTTEYKDLAFNSPGRQALRIEASAPGQSASVKAYFDSYAQHSFVQLHGRYTIAFRAKALTPGSQLNLGVQRLDPTRGNHLFFDKTIPLTSAWHDYTFDFTANEDPSAIGGVQLSFDLVNASALLDDATLTEAAAPNNPTAFRNAVVETLRDLHPGILRYMDNGNSFGSSLDDLLAPSLARRRTGYSTQQTLQEDDAIGLHDFLTLCKAIGADPWISLPPGLSPQETSYLIDYLAGAATRPYGLKRAALGQAAPWTDVFHTIHLELGNEQWNNRSFSGATIQKPEAYAQRASVIFAAARSSPSFKPASFDLVLGSFAVVPWYTMTELAATSPAGRPDSTAVAPYLFNEFNDASSTEAVFGPMFAQPEQVDSRPTGYMAQQLHEASAAHTRLSVYEVNLSTTSGSVTQSQIDQAIPSLGAGLTVIDHMLLMLRDLGITTQCLFALPEYRNGFNSPPPHKDIPLWGAVVDMGGSANLRRPQFLALQLANQAMLPNMMKTTLTGPDPTWNQPLSTNDKIELTGAHDLQTFAFADGPRRSLILLNLSRTEAIPLQFSGPQSPRGPIEESRLNSTNLTDSNESQATILPTHHQLPAFKPDTSYTLPPHSMTTLRWTVQP